MPRRAAACAARLLARVREPRGAARQRARQPGAVQRAAEALALQLALSPSAKRARLTLARPADCALLAAVDRGPVRAQLARLQSELLQVGVRLDVREVALPPGESSPAAQLAWPKERPCAKLQNNK